MFLLSLLLPLCFSRQLPCGSLQWQPPASLGSPHALGGTR